MSVIACPLPLPLDPQIALGKLAEVAQVRSALSPAAQERFAARELGVDMPTLQGALRDRAADPTLSSAVPAEDRREDNTARRSKAASQSKSITVPAEDRDQPYDKRVKRSVMAQRKNARPSPIADPRVKSKNPTTVKGYKQMFNKVDTDEWGGGDVSISYLMPDGRRVWLYGDTWSADNGFVHSTALVQKNGVLTPANNGKQILPNGGKDPADPSREIIYWIDGVTQGPTKDTLLVTAMEMSIGTAGPWDFRKTNDGQSRQALMRVLPNGDMKFLGWKKTVPTPVKGNPHLANDLVDHGGGHVTYGKVTHNIKLADGSYLTTTSQNHTDALENHIGPKGFNWHDFSPTLGSTRTKP